MSAPKVSTTTRAKIWRRIVTFAVLGGALLSPVQYLDATESHNWQRQVFVLLTGPMLLWWGVVGVIRIAKENDEESEIAHSVDDQS